jgi:hypothetical protein
VLDWFDWRDWTPKSRPVSRLPGRDTSSGKDGWAVSRYSLRILSLKQASEELGIGEPESKARRTFWKPCQNTHSEGIAKMRQGEGCDICRDGSSASAATTLSDSGRAAIKSERPTLRTPGRLCHPPNPELERMTAKKNRPNVGPRVIADVRRRIRELEARNPSAMTASRRSASPEILCGSRFGVSGARLTVARKKGFARLIDIATRKW